MGAILGRGDPPYPIGGKRGTIPRRASRECIPKGGQEPGVPMGPWANPWLLGQHQGCKGGPGEQGFTDLRLLAPQGGPDGTPPNWGGGVVL